MRTILITASILITLVATVMATEQAEVCIHRTENQGVLNIQPTEITANGKNLFSIIGGETKCVLVAPGRYDLVAQSPDPYTGPWKLTETAMSGQTDEINIKRVIELVNIPIKQLGENNNSVQAIFGTPSARVVDQLANRHDPKQKDQIHTLTYKGLVVRIYDAASIKKEMLLSVRLTENRPGILPELIGQTKKFIKEKFGEPTSKDENIFTYIPVYNIEEPGQDVVKIEFNNSLVSAVEWSYYVD